MEETVPCYSRLGTMCFGSQQRYHGIMGVTVDDVAGGSNFQAEETGHWEVGKGKFCSREVVQAADGSMRVGQPAFFKSLDFVPLGKMRKEQSGDATETEKSCHEIGARSSRVFSA